MVVFSVLKNFENENHMKGSSKLTFLRIATFLLFLCLNLSFDTISQLASLEEKVSRYKMNVLHYRACILFLLSKQFCLDGLFRNYN